MILNTDMNDLKKAEFLLKENNCSCVLCRGSETLIRYESGISPLVSFVESGRDFSGFCAADRIVGKAAALMYNLMRIKSVYGEVMSKKAAAVFDRAGIDYEYAVLTDEIINRAGTGPCPMEIAVSDTDDPDDAFLRIKDKLKIIDKNQKKY